MQEKDLWCVMERGEEAEMIRASILEPSRVFKSDGTCNSLPRARPGAAASRGVRGEFQGGNDGLPCIRVSRTSLS